MSTSTATTDPPRTPRRRSPMADLVSATAAPVVVEDPVVAVVYGAMAHSSLAAGVATAVDLVANQPGPWQLADSDRAAQAIALVGRLRGEAGEPAAVAASVDVLGEVAARMVLDACRTARQALTDLWTEHHTDMPRLVEHEVSSLEQRLQDFCITFSDGIPVTAASLLPPRLEPPADPDARVEWPTAKEAAGWDLPEWVVLLRLHQYPVPAALGALQIDARKAGKVAPRSLRDVKGREDLARMLLDLIIEWTDTHPDRDRTDG